MKTFCLSVISLLLLTTSGHSLILLEESFDYTSGNLSGKNGGTGFGVNAWLEQQVNPDPITGASLAYGSLTTAGGALHILNPSVNTRNFTQILGVNGATTWISFLVRFDSLSFTNSDIFRLSFSPNDGGVSPAFGVLYDEAQSKSVWNIANDGSGGLTPVYSTAEFVPNVTHLVVASITWNTANNGGSQNLAQETIRMYLNPSLSMEPDASSAIATRNMNVANNSTTGTNRIQKITITADGGLTGWLVDEIRVGQSYSDVVPVPEPCSAILVTLGCGWMLLRRRRNLN